MGNLISIGKVRNTGTNDITVSFFTNAGGDIAITLPAGQSTTLYTIPLAAPDDTMTFNVRLASSTTLRPRSVELSYEVVNGMNQFSYRPLMAQSTPFQAAKNPTHADKNICLDVEYSGDGVVIVGTGDL